MIEEEANQEVQIVVLVVLKSVECCVSEFNTSTANFDIGKLYTS